MIFLLAWILPLGIAIENTGLAAMIGESLGWIGENHGPLVMLSVLYLATSLLTSFFSNNATAVLMVPIAFTAAAQMQVDVKPFLMAVAFAALRQLYDSDGIPDQRHGLQPWQLPIQRLSEIRCAADCHLLGTGDPIDSGHLAVLIAEAVRSGL